MFKQTEQHLDEATGIHHITLKDELGNVHPIKIYVGHKACPSCGAIYLAPDGDIDPKAVVEQALETLHQSRDRVHAYAKKHGLKK